MIIGWHFTVMTAWRQVAPAFTVYRRSA